jgi:hypothetical protein
MGNNDLYGNNVTAWGNVSVGGNTSVGGLLTATSNAMIPLTTPGSGTIVPMAVPGFYAIPVTGSAGQGVFTGSLPSPSSYPGADILVTDTVGTYPWVVTGTMSTFTGQAGTGGTQTLSSSKGTHLFMPAGGTVGFWSDSKSWLICALSGSATLSP